MSNAPKTCLYPDCIRGPATRGLCPQHYTTARRLINEGLTSWEQLEKSGKANPSQAKRTRSNTVGWFLDTPKEQQ